MSGMAWRATALAGVVLAATLATTSGARGTTVPGTVAKVPATFTATSVQIKADRYTRGKVSRYPRGTIIDFQLHNTGKQTVHVQLALASKITFFGSSHISKITREPKPLKPGQRITFQIYFFFRANFALQETVGRKVIASAPITVF